MRRFSRRRQRVAGAHYTYTSQTTRPIRIKIPFVGQILEKIRSSNLPWPKTIAYTAFGFVLIIATLFLWYSKDLPNPYKLNKRIVAQSTKIVDRNGELLYQIHGEENRTLIKFEDIPDAVKQATVALEDRDFYKHSGFNLKGIARAIVYDIFHREAKQGGSTITQQFVKNAVLSGNKKISRKIKEFILSIEIEQIYSKNEILTMYLNEIPYGNNAYGVQAAAKTYFDKDAKDLTLAESALLASLPQAPTYYNPYGSNTDILMGRKDFALDQMAELHLITKEQAAVAKAEVIKFSEPNQGITAPHFVMYVRELLAEQFGEDQLANDGFVVTTTLDLTKQKIAEEAMDANRTSLTARGAKNASLVSLDPKNGQVLAMVGSVDYFDKENDGNVNVAVRLRQPGSSIKPIIYAAAFTQGYSPSTMLMDVPTDFGNGYKPLNYDKSFRGPVSIRRALGNSLNIPAVEALALVGVKEATDLAQKMGLKSLTDPDRYGLSLVLGGGEVRLLEEAAAYATLASQGIYYEPITILKITDKNGKDVYEYKESEHKGIKVLDENVAYLVTNVLSDDSARAEIFGTGGILTLPGRPVAAKTGTTDEYRDAWTMGYTPSLVTGVWAGNNDNTPMAGASGGMVAAPIWNYYMRKALAGTPVEQFSVPSGIEYAEIDALTGKQPLANIPEELKESLPLRREVFLKGQAPTAVDDVHKIVRVIKETGKKAADNCPDGITENKIFLEFHSILPNVKSWEDAVINWAKAAGHNNIPSEVENCSVLVKENQPELKITSPIKNQIIADTLSVILNYKAPKEVAKIEYFLDEVKIAENTEAPFGLTDFTLPDSVSGEATLKVILTDKLGLTANDSIKINIE
ncbi:penicillin-binding protein [Candidatus Microgenomates bacterium]|nr:penicillin-binding protein [Candidatus Microgenomates bacterium]